VAHLSFSSYEPGIFSLRAPSSHPHPRRPLSETFIVDSEDPSPRKFPLPEKCYYSPTLIGSFPPLGSIKSIAPADIRSPVPFLSGEAPRSGCCFPFAITISPLGVSVWCLGPTRSLLRIPAYLILLFCLPFSSVLRTLNQLFLPSPRFKFSSAPLWSFIQKNGLCFLPFATYARVFCIELFFLSSGGG